MCAQINANLTDYEAQEGFELLPPGWYPAEIVDSEIREGKKGPYVNWTFQVVGNPNKIWTITSLGNEISMKILKTMATAAGHKNPNYIADTEELHGRKLMIKLKIKVDDSGEYEPKNEISGYKAMDGSKTVIPSNVPQAHVAAQAMQQQPSNTTKPKMPWETN